VWTKWVDNVLIIYLKIRLKMAMTALNCSDDLASCGYQQAKTMISKIMLRASITNDNTTATIKSAKLFFYNL
jgi:hypothetical protein